MHWKNNHSILFRIFYSKHRAISVQRSAVPANSVCPVMQVSSLCPDSGKKTNRQIRERVSYQKWTLTSSQGPDYFISIFFHFVSLLLPFDPSSLKNKIAIVNRAPAITVKSGRFASPRRFPEQALLRQ